MGTPIEDGAQGGNAPGPNPAWGDALGVIPQELHDQVTPYFQQWDQAANQRVESVNSQLKEWEPYQAFKEHGISPQELEQGLQLMYQLNTNPGEVYRALSEAYPHLAPQGGNSNSNAGGGNSSDDDGPEIDFSSLPEYQQLKGGLELVSQIVLQDQQAKAAAAEDKKLNDELASLKKDHGDFDEGYVLSLMSQGKSGKEAIDSYQALVQRIAPQQKPFAPNIMGGSGGQGSGYPSQAIDPRKLSDKGTRDLVKQFLDAANAES